jgi:hypothetical protein
MSGPNHETCGFCKAFDRHDDLHVEGACRLHAAVVREDGMTQWPEVQDNDWCLEHLPKPKATVET